MAKPETPANGEDGIDFDQEQRRRRRSRSIALGFILAGLVLLFYVVTLAKLGPDVMIRPL